MQSVSAGLNRFFKKEGGYFSIKSSISSESSTILCEVSRMSDRLTHILCNRLEGDVTGGRSLERSKHSLAPPPCSLMCFLPFFLCASFLPLRKRRGSCERNIWCDLLRLYDAAASSVFIATHVWFRDTFLQQHPTGVCSLLSMNMDWRENRINAPSVAETFCVSNRRGKRDEPKRKTVVLLCAGGCSSCRLLLSRPDSARARACVCARTAAAAAAENKSHTAAI